TSYQVLWNSKFLESLLVTQRLDGAKIRGKVLAVSVARNQGQSRVKELRMRKCWASSGPYEIFQEDRECINKSTTKEKMVSESHEHAKCGRFFGEGGTTLFTKGLCCGHLPQKEKVCSDVSFLKPNCNHKLLPIGHLAKHHVGDGHSICKLEGSCSRGENCKFSHERQDDVEEAGTVQDDVEEAAEVQTERLTSKHKRLKHPPDPTQTAKKKKTKAEATISAKMASTCRPGREGPQKTKTKAKAEEEPEEDEGDGSPKAALKRKQPKRREHRAAATQSEAPAAPGSGPQDPQGKAKAKGRDTVKLVASHQEPGEVGPLHLLVRLGDVSGSPPIDYSDSLRCAVDSVFVGARSRSKLSTGLDRCMESTSEGPEDAAFSSFAVNINTEVNERLDTVELVQAPQDPPALLPLPGVIGREGGPDDSSLVHQHVTSATPLEKDNEMAPVKRRNSQKCLGHISD
ncbi:unnamed protein product, partial [Symbiodinium microadriaticum]